MLSASRTFRITIYTFTERNDTPTWLNVPAICVGITLRDSVAVAAVEIRTRSTAFSFLMTARLSSNGIGAADEKEMWGFHFQSLVANNLMQALIYNKFIAHKLFGHLEWSSDQWTDTKRFGNILPGAGRKQRHCNSEHSWYRLLIIPSPPRSSAKIHVHNEKPTQNASQLSYNVLHHHLPFIHF